MLPKVIIARDVWYRITDDLMRVYPREGLAIPLIALQPRDRDRNPCAPYGLTDIAEVLIAEAALVPAQLQENRSVRVSVLPTTDGVVNQAIQRLLRRYPRLRSAAYLHSHPFATGSTWPSRGPSCDVDGHMIPLLRRNRAAGLNASFSFIACRSQDGSRWRLQCFALDQESGEVIDLGFARIVGRSDRRMSWALAPALGTRPLPHFVLRRWHRQLEQRGTSWEHDELFDGWRRTVITIRPGLSAVLLIPVDFPHHPPRLFVVDARQGETREMAPVDLRWTAPDALVRAADLALEAFDAAA